jgi:hypothetical protein
MMEWKDRYIGVWPDGLGAEIRVDKVQGSRFKVSVLRDGIPIARPWMNDEPAVDMPAIYTYDALDGSDFSVDLGPAKSGFCLHLSYEESNYLEPEGGEIISTAVSGPDNDNADRLGEYSKLFLCRELLHRVT